MTFEKIKGNGTLPAVLIAEHLSNAASDLWNIGDYSFSFTLKGSVDDYQEFIDAKLRTVKVEMQSKVECSGRWLREHIAATTSWARTIDGKQVLICPKCDTTYTFEEVMDFLFEALKSIVSEAMRNDLRQAGKKIKSKKAVRQAQREDE